MRTIRKIHTPEYAPIGDLVTYRVLPTRSISYLDPFLFLNHHGPQVYPPDNQGLPFGPHPHRGMETVTFIISGDIVHEDNSGHESIISAGGVQWMTAGRGVIHSEVSSDAFKKNGGPLEILQLWINLPARSKMAEPFYLGLQKNEIPKIEQDDGKVTVDLISGDTENKEAAFTSGIGARLNLVHFKKEGKIQLKAPQDHNIFFYIISGNLQVNGHDVGKLRLVEFENNADVIEVIANEESLLLYGDARPLKEPVVSGGPFVMNTEQEIQQAYKDYHDGKFGKWNS
jgi:redox-sensitive bicupin YhaK (pirin superfamily)